MSSLAAEKREPRARNVAVTEESLTVDLVDGRTVIVPVVWYPRLWHGTPEERNRFEFFWGWDVYPLARFGRRLDGGWPLGRSSLRREPPIIEEVVGGARSEKAEAEMIRSDCLPHYPGWPVK